MDRALPYGVDQPASQLMLQRTGAGWARLRGAVFRFLRIHSSPILMEVALFFKSTLRQTERNGKQHHRHATWKPWDSRREDRWPTCRPWAAGAWRRPHRRCWHWRNSTEPLPEAPGDPFCVLDLLDRVGSPATVATAGGRFFGFVNGAALPVSVAATWLASAWDQNAALRVMSPAAAAIEDVALGWVRDALGLPAECGGAVVTGATMANFTGLAAARHALLERARLGRGERRPVPRAATDRGRR